MRFCKKYKDDFQHSVVVGYADKVKGGRKIVKIDVDFDGEKR